MIMTKYGPVIIACVFTWIGFVCAISFMEAWLKFRAPGITIPLGLGIGRLVFGALNKVEWIFMLVMLGTVFTDGTWKVRSALLLVILLVLLLLQTFWLLPRLDVRAEAYMSGATLPSSYLHFYYVGMEIIKVATLIIYGVLVFQHLSLKENRLIP